VVGASGSKINREDIAAIVDKFLAGRQPEQLGSEPRETRAQRLSESSESQPEAGSMYTGPSGGGRSENVSQAANGGRSSAPASAPSRPSPSTNGAKTVDFVSEDDVRQAIQKGQKIYINAKTIITPAARDMGEPAEVFAKG
jgi:hypothetical protein